jgi:hypothetical protein
MSKWLDELQNELKSSVVLIDKKLNLTEKGIAETSNATKVFTENTESILDTCNRVLEKSSNTKPKMRMLHHMACSGGSLITKCISAMPNTFILSEVHPHSYRHLPPQKATFLPSDIATLAHQAKFPDSKDLAQKIFKSSIKETYKHVSERGGALVLRDHSHSDYCVGDSYADKSVVIELLKKDYDVLSLVTVRNPIDCYASLQSNYWLHFNPQTFEEYCARVLVFLSQFRKNQIVKYESFTRSPDKVMLKMCEILQLEFTDIFQDIFDQFPVTGDSGRKGETISSRPRRELSAELKMEIKKSKSFAVICKKYGFSPAI